MISKDTFHKRQRAVESGRTFKAPTCSINFFFRKKKSDRIQFRVVVCGLLSGDKSTGISCPNPADFDRINLVIAGNPLGTERIRALKEDVLRVFNERYLSGRSLDPDIIRDIALGLRAHDSQSPTFIEAISLWIQERHHLVGNGLSKASMDRYEQYGRILERFISEKYGPKIPLDQLKPSLEHDLFAFLKGKQKYVHNYAVKIIQFVKSVLNYAVAHEWVDRNVLGAVRLAKYHKEVKTLSMADLAKLQQPHFVESTLNEVRDVFLFCCYTGLAYTDVASLSQHHLVDVDGVQCILKDRNKSHQQAFVPLFPEALQILAKYQNHAICRLKGVLLPVISNQKMNNALKIIGNVSGIQETLHTHLARKTFTMYAEERGFQLDHMAVMLGHSQTYMTERHYLQRRRDPVIKQFKKLQEGSSNDPVQKAS